MILNDFDYYITFGRNRLNINPFFVFCYGFDFHTNFRSSTVGKLDRTIVFLNLIGIMAHYQTKLKSFWASAAYVAKNYTFLKTI